MCIRDRRYNTAFDRAGRPTFSFYRERLWRRDRGFRFEGAVHEAVTPQGRVIRREIAVTHQKLHRRDPGRNLRIFEKEAAKGPLTPCLLYTSSPASCSLSRSMRACNSAVRAGGFSP